jgi:uncharacterized lipoprotein YmbA
MIIHREIVRRLLGLAVCLGLASCAISDPTQYFTLAQAPAPTAERTATASTAESGVGQTTNVSVGVGPISIPTYLDRRQIVIRTGTDQLELSAFHRWAEPLEDGMARILAEEIAARVPTERVVTFPWRGVAARAIQYQVVVTVVRFDGLQGGDVTLDTRWRILDPDGKEQAFRRSTVIETVKGQGHEPIVAAMTRAVVSLSREIALEIRALPH